MQYEGIKDLSRDKVCIDFGSLYYAQPKGIDCIIGVPMVPAQSSIQIHVKSDVHTANLLDYVDKANKDEDFHKI